MFNDDLYDAEYARIWKQFPMPELSQAGIEVERSGCREYFRRVATRSALCRDEVEVEDITVPSLIDAQSVPVRIYRPISHEQTRGLVYIHGGGFSVGDLDMEDEPCYLLARDSKCFVASVDYRLVGILHGCLTSHTAYNEHTAWGHRTDTLHP